MNRRAKWRKRERNLGHSGTDFRPFTGPQGTANVTTNNQAQLTGFSTGLDLYNYTYSNWNKIWQPTTKTLTTTSRTGTNNLNSVHPSNPINNLENNAQTNLLSNNYLSSNTLPVVTSNNSALNSTPNQIVNSNSTHNGEANSNPSIDSPSIKTELNEIKPDSFSEQL